MANPTDQSKTGSVTVATVCDREEARPISNKLEAAGIACTLTMEHGVDKRIQGNRFREIKIQVSRADATRAVQLLREKDEQGGAELGDAKTGAPPPPDTRMRPADWRREAVGVIAIVGLAALLAWWLF